MSDKIKEAFEQILAAAKERGASDIHLLLNMPPMVRIAGEISFLKSWQVMDRATLAALAESVLEPRQRQRLDDERELCVSYFSDTCGRQRLTLYHRLGVIEMAVRIAQTEILDRESLGLPPVVDTIIANRSGLILVTGPTGSGKTTTLNYMIDGLNKSLNGKIITIEDPVEFEHRHQRSIVTQVEVGTDTLAFSSFLRSVLRLDPDVIVIGEMRDLETISAALTSAETGHLVLATLHTPSAVGTAERIISAFPGDKQPQAALQVASTLLAVVSQRLVPTLDKQSRVLATEVMIGTSAVRNLIRDSDFHKLPNAIQMGLKSGMHSLESSLVNFYRQGLISRATALAFANDQATIELLLKDQTSKVVAVE
ncbi:MAG: PilT/PilU family type 4a pilus ATPase [Candidatus Adiutrix sp.]|jgi:twitching motility protein PilT|nr:PilT/PilU family type 4a pilus ATPase [Candidatus Adiutrix sp.]